MALAFENFFSGTAQFSTFGGTGSIGSAQSSALNSSGTNRLMVLCFITGRSKASGDTASADVDSVTASGLTWTRRASRQYNYNPVTIAGTGDPSFPNACFSIDIWTAPAASAVSSLSWTSTTSDGFINNQIVFGFAISGLADINSVDFTSIFTDQNLTASTTHPEVTGVSTNGECAVLALFSTRNNGFTFNAESGYTISQNAAGGNSTSNAKFALDYAVEASAISGKVIGDATGNTDCWYGLAFGIGSTSPATSARVTSVAAEVMETLTSTARVTSVAAEVLSNTASSARVTSVAAEVLRSITDSAPSSAIVTSVAAEVMSDATSAARVTSVAAEVLVATGTAPPLDGSRFLEARFQLRPTQSYAEADYDSIWSIGDRANGNHMTFGEYGMTIFPGATMASSHDGNVAFPFGSGLAISDNPFVTGAGAWLDFGTEFVDIRGFKFHGTDEYAWDDNEPWSFYGAFDVGQINDEPYPTEFDALTPSQSIENVALSLFESEWEFTPRDNQIWTHYEFVFIGASQTLSATRFANEILYKVAHSSLDGGDRRSTNSRPDKRVAFSMSSAWTFRDDADFDDPATSLFDGAAVWVNGPLPGGDEKNGLGNFASIYKAGVGGSAEQDTIGAWLQFVYPREVIPRHLCFVTLTQVEEYISDVPQHFGTWHWEFSKDSGSTWTAVGEPWSFEEDSKYMVAPRFGAWDLNHADLGQGASHWRMVLNSGPAFRSNYKLGQILFDLNDPGSLATNFRIDFSDDLDGSSPTVTIEAQSPYNVKFTDNDSDALNFTLTNTPNFDGVIAFTDGTTDALEFYGDFMPSIFPQTIVVATGRF